MRGTSTFDRTLLKQPPSLAARAGDAGTDGGDGRAQPSSWILAWRDWQAQTDYRDSVRGFVGGSAALPMDRYSSSVPLRCDSPSDTIEGGTNTGCLRRAERDSSSDDY